MRWLIVSLFVTFVLAPRFTTSAEEGGAGAVAAPEYGPVTVYVVVALCDNAQIACGSGGLGSPGNLKTNLYWGALYGAKRMLDRPESGWTPVAQTTEVEGVLERAVYRRWIEASGGEAGPREQLLVLDAFHGAAIDAAVKRFFSVATHGAAVAIDDGDERRTLEIDLAGYAGHNRMMDGLRLPEVTGTERRPVPSFVLACLSDRFFAEPLRAAGSEPLVTTRSYMAPEGYVVEAAARAFGDRASVDEMRAAVIGAYARWQRIGTSRAANVFVR